MDDREEEEVKPCRCGTGDYCQRHRRYGKTTSKKEHRALVADSSQACGGGFRLLRKIGGE